MGHQCDNVYHTNGHVIIGVYVILLLSLNILFNENSLMTYTVMIHDTTWLLVHSLPAVSLCK